MKNLLINLFASCIKDWVDKEFTEENVQKVFQKVLTAAKEQTAKTSNTVDDWCLKTLEYIASDLNLVSRFVTLARKLFLEGNNQNQNVLYSSALDKSLCEDDLMHQLAYSCKDWIAAQPK